MTRYQRKEREAQVTLLTTRPPLGDHGYDQRRKEGVQIGAGWNRATGLKDAASFLSCAAKPDSQACKHAIRLRSLSFFHPGVQYWCIGMILRCIPIRQQKSFIASHTAVLPGHLQMLFATALDSMPPHALEATNHHLLLNLQSWGHMYLQPSKWASCFPTLLLRSGRLLSSLLLHVTRIRLPISLLFWHSSVTGMDGSGGSNSGL